MLVAMWKACRVAMAGYLAGGLTATFERTAQGGIELTTIGIDAKTRTITARRCR